MSKEKLEAKEIAKMLKGIAADIEDIADMTVDDDVVSWETRDKLVELLRELNSMDYDLDSLVEDALEGCDE